MISQELMLGDWVQFTSEQWLTEEDACPLKVTCVGEPKYPDFYPYIRIEGRNENYHIDLFQPIPLTQEILEKNGFTKGGMFGKTYYLAVEDFEISVYFAHVNTQLIIEKRNGREIINMLNVEYLHILQHALRLCGIEKQIEL